MILPRPMRSRVDKPGKVEGITNGNTGPKTCCLELFLSLRLKGRASHLAKSVIPRLPLNAPDDNVMHSRCSDVGEASTAITGKGTEVGAVRKIKHAIRVRKLWFFCRI